MYAWITPQIVVSTRYHTAAARKSSNGWKTVGPLAFFREKVTYSSGTEMITRSDVVLSMLLNSLPSGGTITRAAWGRMIRRIALPYVMPRDLAASSWPGSIDRMPARTISDM